MPARDVELIDIALPDFGLPTTEPHVPPAEYRFRLEEAGRRARAAGYDALVVYGDREHFANLAYLTAYDPRFEEALLIVVPNHRPTLLVGNEGMAYSHICPYDVERVLYQSFSLISQPRDRIHPLREILARAGIDGGQKVGIAGWKYYVPTEVDDPAHWIETPSFLVETLRSMGCEALNAGALFMATDGLRAGNNVDQLAAFEFAATWSSQSVRDLLFTIRAGMTELEAFQLLHLNGLPLSYHPLINSGRERTGLGLAGPTARRMEIGDPVFAALGVWGSNTARAGFLVEDAAQLPTPIRDYVSKLVAPYFSAVVDWYEHIGVGVTGGELYDGIQRHLGAPFFGVSLNPGHLIHLDEWVSSPVYRGSVERLASGMAIAVDIIPATGTEYHTTNIEDVIALADQALRKEFSHAYPEAWARIARRRAFMKETLGIRLAEEVLPFSNMPAYLPPFWLSPGRAMRVAPGDPG
jgi:hypothetical protein